VDLVGDYRENTAESELGLLNLLLSKRASKPARAKREKARHFVKQEVLKDITVTRYEGMKKKKDSKDCAPK